jgi:hypothetical protein
MHKEWAGEALRQPHLDEAADRTRCPRGLLAEEVVGEDAFGDLRRSMHRCCPGQSVLDSSYRSDASLPELWLHAQWLSPQIGVGA